LSGCSAHGICQEGTCRCTAGWGGPSCAIPAQCPVQCGHPRGRCVSGVCHCASGFFGPACEDVMCPHNCFGHGICNRGACECNEGWLGHFCDSKLDASPRCDPPCVNDGFCVNSQCFCGPGFGGVDCSQPVPVARVSESRPLQSLLARLARPPTRPGIPAMPEAATGSITAMIEPGMQQEQAVRTAQMRYFQAISTMAPQVIETEGEIDAYQSHRSHALPVSSSIASPQMTVRATAHAMSASVQAVVHKPGRRGAHLETGTSRSTSPTSSIGTALSHSSAPSHAGRPQPAQASRGKAQWAVEGLEAARRAVRIAGLAADRLQRAAELESHEDVEDQTAESIPRAQAARSEPARAAALGQQDADHEDSLGPSDAAATARMPAAVEIGRRALAQLSSDIAPTEASPLSAPAVVVALPSGMPEAKLRGLAHTVGSCEADCSGHGICSTASGEAKCHCHGGWLGMLCDMPRCKHDCHGRGLCIRGECVCHGSWYGDSCAQQRCPDDCSGSGYCFGGSCHCTLGFEGPNCATVHPVRQKLAVRLRHAAPAGAPEGVDRFLATASLRATPPKACPQDCSNRGICTKDGQCRCMAGYSGSACQSYCPNECSHQGDCVEGACLCYAGFLGVDCSINSCCSGHGSCDDPAACVCWPGWGGADCSVRLLCADPSCSGHGTCSEGNCLCKPGFTGATCAATAGGCNPPCGANGMCNPRTKKCDCTAGFTGPACTSALLACPGHCSNKGLCMNGRCMCGEGWMGVDCSQRYFVPGTPTSDLAPPSSDE